MRHCRPFKSGRKTNTKKKRRRKMNTKKEGGGIMVLHVTFNNISVISWRSVLLVEETGENH
jgi:hypothetical protein